MSQTNAQLVDYGTAVASSVPTNGPYLSATNTVAISTNGSQRVTVNSSGNVGIGTASPATTLDVNGGAQITGSVSGYDGGEVRLGSTTAAIQSAITTQATGSPVMFFDHRGTSNTGIFAWRVGTGGASERMRIDSSGRVLVGTSTARSNVNNGAPPVQIETAVASASTGLSIINNSSAGWTPRIALGLSGGTTIGSTTAVQNTNVLGYLSFVGADGTNFIEGARIEAVVDGTPGTNDMPGRLVFSTTADGASSPTERMRITNGGATCIGTQSATGLLSVEGNGPSNYAASIVNTTTNSNVLLVSGTAASNNQNKIVFSNGGTVVGLISTTASTTSYVTSSDYRLKENIKPVVNGITRLQQLKPSRFNFIADPDTTVDGFIAHEVQAVVPEAISGEKDAVDDDGDPIYQGIDQSKLVPLLTAALQEAVERIEVLEQRLTDAGIA